MSAPTGKTNSPLEIEVKFFLPDAESLRARIVAAGGISRGRTFETNLRFDDRNNSLAERLSLLRLRKDDHAVTLTFKSAPPEPDGRFKIQHEYEVSVSNMDTMIRILERLGFEQQQVYEKWRETFLLDGTQLCLDTMPFGDFLEIEGASKSIIATAAHLGFVWENRILHNYLEIFDLIRETFGLPFNDVTFQNFSTVQIDPTPLVTQMRAG